MKNTEKKDTAELIVDRESAVFRQAIIISVKSEECVEEEAEIQSHVLTRESKNLDVW